MSSMPDNNGCFHLAPVDMQAGAPGEPGFTLRVFLHTGPMFVGRNSTQFSRHDEYADKENYTTPDKDRKHATRQGIRNGREIRFVRSV
jgi:hypothetical protein